MAGRLDWEDERLLERLVDEIALRGNTKGIGVDELRNVVVKIHDAESNHDTISEGQDVPAHDAQLKTTPTATDDKLVDRVLVQLANHPDIEIRTIDAESTPAPAWSTIEDETSLSNAGTTAASTNYSSKRIFTTESRAWRTITGHEKGEKVIPTAELQLLFAIASNGSEGILQPDATRATGQDKRSVPLRTDKLVERGYIVKEAVLRNQGRKRMRTSLLKLKKFAVASDITKEQTISTPSGENLVFYDEWYRKTIQLLKDNDNIVAFQDLRVELEIDSKQPETRAYAACIDRLVETGCLRKLKAKIESDSEKEDDSTLIPCVQLLKEPNDSDVRAFNNASDVSRAQIPGTKSKAKARAIVSAEQNARGSRADADMMDEEVLPDPLPERLMPSQLTPERSLLSDQAPANNKSTKKKRDADAAGLETESSPFTKTPRKSKSAETTVPADVAANAKDRTTGDPVPNTTNVKQPILRAIDPNSTPQSQVSVEINPPGAVELKNQASNRPGRRPKALIAVFKLDRLRNLEPSRQEDPKSSPISTPLQHKKKRSLAVESQQQEQGDGDDRPRKRKKSAKAVEAAEAAQYADEVFNDDVDEDLNDDFSLPVVRSREPDAGISLNQSSDTQVAINLPKKRGRPSKAALAEHEKMSQPIKRGRPPKTALAKRERVRQDEVRSKVPSLVVKLPISPVVPNQLTKNDLPMAEAETSSKKTSLIAKLPVSPSLSYKTSNAVDASPVDPEPASRRASLIAKLPISQSFDGRNNGIENIDVQEKDAVRFKGLHANPETSERPRLIAKLPFASSGTVADQMRTQPLDDSAAASQEEDEQDDSTSDYDEDLDMIDDGALDPAEDPDYNPDVEPAFEDGGFDVTDERSYTIEDLEDLPALIQIDTDLADHAFLDDNRTNDNTPRRGGAVRRQRNEIAMSIMKKVGGAFPGKQSFHYPFATACRKANVQTPAIHTSTRIVESLIFDGNLRRYSFQFKAATGVMHERDIIAEADLDPTSDVAKTVQKAILDSFPRMYLPKAVEVDRSLFRTDKDLGRKKKLPKSYDARYGPVRASKMHVMTQLDEFPVLEGATVKRTSQGVAAENSKSPTQVQLSRERKNAFSHKFSISEFYSRSSALLVRPSQSFYEPSGTFGTLSILGPTRDILLRTPTFTRVPNGLESILADAEKLNIPPVGQSATQAERFIHDVDAVAAWEAQAELNKDPEDDFIYVNHGLNCPHVIPQPNEGSGDLFYADGRLAVSKAEKLRKKTAAAKSAPQFRLPSSTATTVPNAKLPLPPTSSSAARFYLDFVNSQNASQGSPHGPATMSQSNANSASSLLNGHQQAPRPLKPQLSTNSNSDPSQILTVTGKRKRAATYKAQQNLETNRVLAQELNIHEPDGEYEPPPPKRQYVKKQKADEPPPKRQQVKKPKKANFQEAERLSIAVAVVRALCHGVDAVNFQQWHIVSHALSFKYDAGFLQKRWQYQTRETGSGEFADELQQILYEPFLRAYQEGQLPHIDFENLQLTDWPALVQWVENEILPGEGGEWSHELSFTRKNFEDNFDVKLTTEDTAQWQLQARVPSDSALPKGAPIVNSYSDPKMEPDLELAISWIRATIMTRDKNFDSKKATDKLKLLDVKSIEQANTKLLQSGDIFRAKVGRLLPGRNFYISKQYLSEFRRWPGGPDEFRFLRDVSSARDDLVEHFKESEQMSMSPDVCEAKMLVLTNMMSQGLLEIKTILPERNDDMDAPFPRLSKWGHGDLSHTDRQLDIEPSDFHFPVVYSKTPLYTTQHGLKADVAVPQQPSTFDGEPGLRIPLWVDIHGNILDDVWDMVLRSVLHVLVYKPGILTKGIEIAHHGRLRTWEAQLVLDWMESVGVAVRFGAGKEENGVCKSGWRASDWWYCVLSPEVPTWSAPADAMSDGQVIDEGD